MKKKKNLLSLSLSTVYWRDNAFKTLHKLQKLSVPSSSQSNPNKNPNFLSPLSSLTLSPCFLFKLSRIGFKFPSTRLTQIAFVLVQTSQFARALHEWKTKTEQPPIQLSSPATRVGHSPPMTPTVRTCSPATGSGAYSGNSGGTSNRTSQTGSAPTTDRGGRFSPLWPVRSNRPPPCRLGRITNRCRPAPARTRRRNPPSPTRNRLRYREFAKTPKKKKRKKKKTSLIT